LDEPTAILAPQEADALYAMLARLADAGRSIAVVTHKLDEVHAHARSVTVMRRGKIVSSREVDHGQPREEFVRALAKDVMGGEPPSNVVRSAPSLGNDTLVVDALVVYPNLRGATLRVRAGEIVGVAGIEGSGQEELVRAIAGIARPSAGRIRTPGTERPAVVFGDRHREGLVLEASVLDNALLGEWPLDRKEAEARIERGN